MSEEQTWSVGRLLTWTADYFAGQGSDSPRLDAEVLLAKALGCKRIELYTQFNDEPPEGPRTKFRELVRQRAGGVPVAYLVGSREFYSLEFRVTPDVLIPRSETEDLVVKALDWLKEHPTASVVDIGTGSGAIIVSVAKHAPTAKLTAVDVSSAALAIAAGNAEQHGVADRIAFVESDLLSAVDESAKFDLILSNPPYVMANELITLDPTVRDHEPHLALDGGEEGTTVIEPLLIQIAERLADGGECLIEIGPSIVERVEMLVEKTDGLILQETIKDLAGHKRIVHAVKG